MQVKVGDEIIVDAGYSKPPVVTEVIKVTPKGQFYVKAFDCRFKPHIYQEDKAEEVGKNWGRWSRPKEAFPFAAELLKELNERYLRHQENEKEKQEREDRRHAEARSQKSLQIQKMKALIDWTTLQKTVLPDGRRLYQGLIPLSEGAAKCNGYCHAIISCKDIPESDWGYSDKRKVEQAITYATQRSSSFSSVSTSYFASDEDAVYDAIRYLYGG